MPQTPGTGWDLGPCPVEGAEQTITGVCQASPHTCEVGCIVLLYKWVNKGSREEVTCSVTQQETEEPDPSPSWWSSQAHTSFLIKDLKLKAQGLSAQLGEEGRVRTRDTPRACPLLAC